MIVVWGYITCPSLYHPSIGRVIYVNDGLIDLTDLHDQNKPTILEIEEFGQVLVRHIVSEPGRTSKQHGVAWWVNRLLVLDSSWRGIDDIPFTDARSTEAKRHIFIVTHIP